MDDNDQTQANAQPSFDAVASNGSTDVMHADIEFLTFAAALFQRPAHMGRRQRNLAESFFTLRRVFDMVETLKLRCSVLEAEKMQAQQSTDSLLQGAVERIQDLEEVVAGLLRLVAKYDALLNDSAGRTHEAERRADRAELRVRETERGTSDAVEWLYRYMANTPHLPG